MKPAVTASREQVALESTTAPLDSDSLGWADFRGATQEALREYFEASGAKARRMSAGFGPLWEHIQSAATGGKLMRPRLVHLGALAFGGSPGATGARLAAAFEILHTGLLMHDDVIDRDFVRRDKPTVGARYRDLAAQHQEDAREAEHIGQSVAIIAGDLLLTGAIHLAASTCARLPHGIAVLDVMNEAIMASAAGELEDVMFSVESCPPDVAQILGMERLKTAAYSFEAPLQAGALLAGASPDQASALAEVGRDIGIAYQVIDDVLGTFGDSRVTGKPTDSDLREGKRTVLTTFAASTADFEAQLVAFRGGALQLGELREALRASGAHAYALDLAEGLVANALDTAGALSLPQVVHDELIAISTYVLDRSS